jgi:hypothetical protein
MALNGHSRHFDRAPLTSGLLQLADILRVIRHVSKVPTAVIGEARQYRDRATYLIRPIELLFPDPVLNKAPNEKANHYSE